MEARGTGLQTPRQQIITLGNSSQEKVSFIINHSQLPAVKDILGLSLATCDKGHVYLARKAGHRRKQSRTLHPGAPGIKAMVPPLTTKPCSQNRPCCSLTGLALEEALLPRTSTHAVLPCPGSSSLCSPAQVHTFLFPLINSYPATQLDKDRSPRCAVKGKSKKKKKENAGQGVELYKKGREDKNRYSYLHNETVEGYARN